jgi:hypothetical protein
MPLQLCCWSWINAAHITTRLMVEGLNHVVDCMMAGRGWLRRLDAVRHLALYGTKGVSLGIFTN